MSDLSNNASFDFSNYDLYNHIYIPLLYSKKRYRILYGGRDSGKSDFIVQDCIISALTDPFFRLILLRKFYASIKMSQFQTIIDYIRLWELGDLFHITLNPLFIYCKENGNQILAKGLDQSDNTKSIKDPTAIWYEEADQISEDAFTESSLSLRSSRNVVLKEYLSFNPRKESTFINKLFFPPVKNSYEKPDGNFSWVKSINDEAVILHTNYKNNRFCSQKRIERLESLKNQDENYYKVNTLGLWGGALKGLIYPDWTPIDRMPEGGDEIFTLDYGFNDPAALTWLSYKEKKLSVKELIYVTNHNHQQLVNLIISDYKSLIGKRLIIVDSAVPELVSLLRNAGFNAISAVKGPGSVYKGILLVKQLELCITKDSLNIIAEAQSYIWKEDNAGKLIDDPVDMDNHALDGIRYGVQTYGIRHWLINRNRNRNTSSPMRRERNLKDTFSGF